MSTRLLVFLLMMLALLAFVTPASADDVSVRLEAVGDAETLVLQTGQSSRIRVTVAEIPSQGLAAFQVELSFDASKVHLYDPNGSFVPAVDSFAPLGGNPFCAIVRETTECGDPNWFLTATGRSPTGTTTIDNVNGKVVIAYGTHGSAALPSGDGVLALIDVTGIVVGEAPISFDTVVLSDGADPPATYATNALGIDVEIVSESSSTVPGMTPLGAGLLILSLLAFSPARSPTDPSPLSRTPVSLFSLYQTWRRM